MTEAKAEKRQVIMQAAITVFSHKGYAGATMEDVATQAGLGKGTLYLYFASKEDLLKEILSTGLESLYEGFQTIAERPGSARERLEGMAFLEADVARCNRNLVQFIMEGVGSLGYDFKRILLDAKSEMAGVISHVVEQGIASGEIGPVNTQILSNMFLAIVTGSAIDETPALEPKEIAREITRILFEGVAP